MTRASSRIKKSKRKKIKRERVIFESKKQSESKKQRVVKTAKKNNLNSVSSSWLKGYLTHLPTLFFAFVSCYLTYLFVINISPETVRHFILPNTYLPLIILVFISSFFLSSYILLNSRRGLFTASYLSLLTFLAVQQVILDWRVIGILLIPFLVIETILSLII